MSSHKLKRIERQSKLKMLMMSGKYKVAMMVVSMMIGLTATTASGGGGSLMEQCSTSIQQLTSCLSYATGKLETPTKECCTGINEMREKQPVCLCFFIGQAHNGSSQIKSLGIQEPKLLQLPNACHLVNASVSNCPKLLGMSPSSPAAAIFNASSPAAASSSSSSPVTAGGDNSSGYKLKYSALFVAIFVSLAFGFLSSFD